MFYYSFHNIMLCMLPFYGLIFTDDTMTLPLRQLEAFRAVLTEGSVTRAATYMKISQPAVSRLISSLEENLGFALFKRERKKLQPTAEARFLLDEVERALSHLDHIRQLTVDIENRHAGNLRIACLPGFATSLLPRILARFLKDRPGVTLTFEPDRPDRIIEWVIGQQYDVGITEQFDGHPAIECETIPIRTVCILPPKHALSEKPSITPQDLNNVPMIHGYRDHNFYRTLRTAFDLAGATFKSGVETRQFGPACIMVSEGLGVSVVSEIDAREYESRGLIIKPFTPAIPFHINILYPAYVPRSMVTHEFIDTFKESLQPFKVNL